MQQICRMAQTSNPAEIAVTYLRGVGPKRAEHLRTVGIETIADLLYYFPRKYLDRSNLLPIAQLQLGMNVTVVGRVVMHGLLRARKPYYEVVIQDETGHLPLLWFGGIKFIEKKFRRDMTLSVSGQVTEFKGLQIVHPEVDVLFEDEEEAKLHTGRIIPLYPSTEFLKHHYLDSRGFRRIIKPALDAFAGGLAEAIPASIVVDAQLRPLPENVRQMHYPDSFETRERARHELALRELVMFELLVADRRRRLAQKKKAYVPAKPEQSFRDWVKGFPFKLTKAQNKAVAEIFDDLFKPHPMLRLLQGDVGSGKTVVATLAMALVARSGFQAALMAPTEILAQQHFQTISRPLSDLGETPALLTGSTPACERNAIMRSLATGETRIIVGTHALISRDVNYSQLALVIVDEQHRFGVSQRDELLAKGQAPDLLVMTATPIPRTLALTAYGDLDLSLIDELPAGRVPVRTALRTAADRPKIYSFIEEEALKGNQIFIIYPLVEESLKVQLKAAKQAYADLSSEIFPGLDVGLVHGQMHRAERDEMMRRFSAREISVLVATTVVEVGIDIPDATVILIEHAERFGLSQLHQLRGRVGRSDKKSYCILMTEMEPSSESYRRLEKFVATTDGFQLAELDLELRGPGDLLGVRQSGLPQFRVANLATDLSLILTAREYADKLLTNALPLTPTERTRLNEYIKHERERETAGGLS